ISSTVEDLRNGEIKTSKNKAQSPYTILLVGETGVGKSAVLQFIANVLLGNPVFSYDLTILKESNEEGGSQGGSQTNAAQLYKLKSKNGIEVNILDTPGLADTRGLQRDEIHKKSIATQIKENIPSVNAVIILANGTVPRITVGTDYALNTLSALFPKTLASNIGFLFTNVSSPLSWNFSLDTLPSVLKNAPLYLLDNPVALQKKYEKLKGQSGITNKVLNDMKKAVRAGEQAALEMLVDVFDWLDGLVPQATTSILTLYETSQQIEHKISDTLSQIEQAETKRQAVTELIQKIQTGAGAMENHAKYVELVNNMVWKQQESSNHSTLCNVTGCYSNCHEQCTLNFSLDPSGLKECWAMEGTTCRRCKHSMWQHSHYRVLWKQVVDTQVRVNQSMKEKWENAKTGKERDEAARQNMEKTIGELAQSIEQHTNELGDLTSRYAGLSLSGSFSAQVEKAISLMAQSIKSMEESGVSLEQLEKVKASLKAMEGKLKLLRAANEKAAKSHRTPTSCDRLGSTLR
ncbi:hypothetical protein DL93DRAFT_2052816, partial [Clavulina sp. PMI_390]